MGWVVMCLCGKEKRGLEGGFWKVVRGRKCLKGGKWVGGGE